MKNLTKLQLVERVGELAVEHCKAHHAVTCLREEYKDECFRYFRNHGEPYPDRHGIDYSDPAYDGVIRYWRWKCCSGVPDRRKAGIEQKSLYTQTNTHKDVRSEINLTNVLRGYK